MASPLDASVRLRAGDACEYFRMSQALDPVRFCVDHIVARQHRGPTRLPNLALACFYCNTSKGPNLAGIDPQTGKFCRLIHPRRHKWQQHFRWNGPELLGRTAVGRTTIAVLAINDSDRVTVRAALIAEGAFTPALLSPET